MGIFPLFLRCAHLASLCRRHSCSHVNFSAASTLIVNSFAYLFFFLRHFVVLRQCTDTALHCMQRGLSNRKAVCPSVCLSVKCVNCEKKRTKVLPTFLYHMKGRSSSFLTMPDFPFYLKFWAKLTPPHFKKRIFQSKFTRSASALTPSEKSSIITNRRSTTGFPMSLT